MKHNGDVDNTSSCRDCPVEVYIASLDDDVTPRDFRTLTEMMRRASGHEPQL